MGRQRTYGEPNINSSKSIMYSTWHQNWQSRCMKETYAAMPEDWADSALAPREAPVDMRAWEHCPVGTWHARNNNSKAFARVLGGGSWHASGGIRTMQREKFGDPQLAGRSAAPGDLQGPAALVAGLRASASAPNLPRPGERTIAANIVRAQMNRSVASVLRGADPNAPAPLPPGTPVPVASGADRGAVGNPALRPGDRTVAANIVRAQMNRSVASVLRGADPNAPPPLPPGTPAPVDLVGEYKGDILGDAAFRRPQDASINAHVLRAMPNVGVGTVLWQARH